MIRPVIKLIKALQSNAAPEELAAGVVLALYFGLTPLNHTHVIFLVLAFFFIRINRAVVIVTLPLVKLAYYMGLAWAADRIGTWVLIDVKILEGFWTWFTHAPVLAYLDFNYTLVVGGYLLATLLAIPAYILAMKGVKAYRAGYKDTLDKWRVTKWIKGLTISKWILSWWP